MLGDRHGYLCRPPWGPLMAKPLPAKQPRAHCQRDDPRLRRRTILLLHWMREPVSPICAEECEAGRLYTGVSKAGVQRFDPARGQPGSDPAHGRESAVLAVGLAPHLLKTRTLKLESAEPTGSLPRPRIFWGAREYLSRNSFSPLRRFTDARLFITLSKPCGMSKIGFHRRPSKVWRR